MSCLVIVASALTLGRGCSDVDVPAAELADAGSAADSGVDAGSGVVVPPGCDLTKDPKDAPACVDNGVGIFVAPTGNDNARGSKALPVKTISKGVELAASRGLPRVYICEGTYDAAVEIKNAVSLYGGLTCAWEYTGVKPKLAPPTGIALRVTKVNAPIVIQDIEVVGTADAKKPGDSAIAAFVGESTSVAFRAVTLVARDATAGSTGQSASNWSGAVASGSATTTATGGSEQSCTCSDGTTSSKGGRGGTVNGLVPQSGVANPAVGASNAGLNGDADCSPGTAGANGGAGAAGTAAATPGKLTTNGWDPKEAGLAGANGGPGQGGGGGGSKASINIGGGGGACGGCGGAGGGPGSNGGASFALLSVNSAVTIDAGSLATGAGGRGGDGADGQAGQAGGAVGTGACNGGVGGNGAGGSGGGGGAGGHSVPIGFVGTEPRVNGATLTPGAKGSGGAGGAGGTGPGVPGAMGSAGPEGKAQNTLSL